MKFNAHVTHQNTIDLARKKLGYEPKLIDYFNKEVRISVTCGECDARHHFK